MPKLNFVLLQESTETETIGNECNVHILHRCKCDIEHGRHQCNINDITLALKNVKPWSVTNLKFIPGGIHRIFDRLHGNDKLCFIWDKYTSKDLTMRTCLELAIYMKEKAGVNCILHIEIHPKALPIGADQKDTVKCHISERSDAEWAKKLHADLKGLLFSWFACICLKSQPWHMIPCCDMNDKKIFCYVIFTSTQFYSFANCRFGRLYGLLFTCQLPILLNKYLYPIDCLLMLSHIVARKRYKRCLYVILFDHYMLVTNSVYMFHFIFMCG